MSPSCGRMPSSWAVLALLAALAAGCKESPATSGHAHAAAAEPIASPQPQAAAQTVTLHAEGLTCEGCAWQIRETLGAVDGVASVEADVASRRVNVTYDSARTTLADIQRALRTAGYETTVTTTESTGAR